MNYDVLDQAVHAIRKAWHDAHPAVGLILGSGWSDVAEAFQVRGTISYADIPGLGMPGVEGHAGRLVRAEHAGLETFVFQGRRHWYEGEGWTPVALPVYVLRQMGAPVIVLTNASGGIRQDLEPGALMVIDDHINCMSAHPLIGPAHAVWGPRFADQTRVYDRELRAAMDRAGAAAKVPLSHGVYIAVSGPTYETPAEIRAYATMGADAVGMSTVPEAMLANAAGLRVAGLSCITNHAAGILDQPLTHDEVTAATRSAMPRMRAVLLNLWEEMAHARH